MLKHLYKSSSNLFSDVWCFPKIGEFKSAELFGVQEKTVFETAYRTTFYRRSSVITRKLYFDPWKLGMWSHWIDILTESGTWLQVSKGHGVLVAMTWKLYESLGAGHWFPLKMAVDAVTLTEVKLIWLVHIGYFKRWIFSHAENLPNPKMTVCVTFKSFKCDRGDLGNKRKVKLLTNNKRVCHCASWVKKSNLIYGHLLIMEKLNFDQ